jgi:hypothetical protein
VPEARVQTSQPLREREPKMMTKCITIWTDLSIFNYQMKKIGKTYPKKKFQILVEDIA